MPKITRYIFKIVSFAVGFSAIFIIVCMMIGSLVTTERFSAVMDYNSQTPVYVYLIDLRRGLPLRVYPQLDQRTISNIQPSRYESDYVYIWQRRGGDGGDTGDAAILSRMGILTGDIETLLDTHQHAISAAALPSESPIISPNGRYFAFGNYELGSIYVLDNQTKTVQQVFDLSQHSDRSNERGYATLQWSPDSQYLTFTTTDALYLLRPDKNAPFEIPSPGRTPIPSQWGWSKDGKTIWFSSRSTTSGKEIPPSRFELTTHHLETIAVPEENAINMRLVCDELWLTYMVPHQLNARPDHSGDNPSRYSGYIRNTKTDEVFALDDVLPSESAHIEYIGMSNCDTGRPVALIGTQIDGLSETASQHLTALYLFDLESQKLTQVRSMGNVIHWGYDNRRFVYSVYKEDDLRIIYSRGFQIDSQPVRVGIYMGDYVIRGLSRDYSQALVVDVDFRESALGRLMRADLQTGLKTYLTPPGEYFMYPQVIPWD